MQKLNKKPNRNHLPSDVLNFVSDPVFKMRKKNGTKPIHDKKKQPEKDSGNAAKIALTTIDRIGF